MIFILFSALWGALLSLLLCAPYGYYPLFLIMLAASIAVYIASKKFFKIKPKFMYFTSAIAFAACYILCTYTIFKPADFHYADTSNTVKGKKAVIFYCEGEMEKYTPYYANCFFKDIPLILKPFYAVNTKRIYREIGVNAKNKELINTALEVKNSLLNNNPYYFYICFDSYTPDIRDSIVSAISDGCGSITFINYSAKQDLKNEVSKKINIEYLNSKEIDVKFCDSVYNTEIFNKYIVSEIINMPFLWDGILLIDEETPTSLKIKSELMGYGYKNHQISISQDITLTMDKFKSNGAVNILYVNLREAGSGINAEVLTPKKMEKYSSAMKINGIKSWGYDKKLVKAAIDTFLDTENK